MSRTRDCADADKHLHEIRSADREERDIRLARDGARRAGFFPVPGEPTIRMPLGMRPPSFWKPLGVLEELDQLLDFVLRLLDAGDIFERDPVFFLRHHPGLRLAEIERPLAGHLDLGPEEKIQEDHDEENGQKADNRGGE